MFLQSKLPCHSLSTRSTLRCAESANELGRLWHTPSAWANQSGRLISKLYYLRSAPAILKRLNRWSLILCRYTSPLAAYGLLWSSCSTRVQGLLRTSTRCTSRSTRRFMKFPSREKSGVKELDLHCRVTLLTDTLISQTQKAIWSLQFSSLLSTATRSWNAWDCTCSLIRLRRLRCSNKAASIRNPTTGWCGFSSKTPSSKTPCK